MRRAGEDHGRMGQAASSATSRSCSSRSSAVNAIGRDAQRANTGVAVHRQPLAHHVGRPAQRHAVDQHVRDSRHRLLALAFEVQVLNLGGLRLKAVATDELVVEVLLARAHTADVEGDEWTHRVAGTLEVVGDEDVHGRGDVEVLERFARSCCAFLQQRAQLRDVLGREQRRNPAVGDLAGKRGVLRAR